MGLEQGGTSFGRKPRVRQGGGEAGMSQGIQG